MGISRTKSGGYIHTHMGKVMWHAPSLAKDPWRPANGNFTNGNKAGYRKVAPNSRYYWRVELNAATGKWAPVGLNYYEKNKNKFSKMKEFKF